MDLSIGRLVGGRYRIVYRVRDDPWSVVVDDILTHNRNMLELVPVAPAALPTDAITRIGAGIAAARSCESDAIEVPVEFILDHDALWLVHAALRRGESLQRSVERGGPMPLAFVIDVIAAIAGALDRVHQQGIVFGRLTPANVLIEERDDGSVHVTLLEVALHALPPEPSPYFAPEQAERVATSAVDVWALGLVAFFALTGTPFFRAETVSTLMPDILMRPIPRACDRAAQRGVTLPPELDAWFARCLTRAPNKRFASAGEAASALRAASASEPIDRRAAILERRQRFVEQSFNFHGIGKLGTPQTCLIVPQPCLSIVTHVPDVPSAPPPPVSTTWARITLRLACPFCGASLDPTVTTIACACGATTTMTDDVRVKLALFAHEIADGERTGDDALSIDNMRFERDGDEPRLRSLRVNAEATSAPLCPACGGELAVDDEEIACVRGCTLEGTRGHRIGGSGIDALAFRPTVRGAPYRADNAGAASWATRFRGDSPARERRLAAEREERQRRAGTWDSLRPAAIGFAVALVVGAIAWLLAR